MSAPLTRHDLVTRLADARRAANLSIRRAAALANVPPSTAQGWFEGRHLPTPALMPNFLSLLDALSLTTNEASRAQWHQAVTRLRNGQVNEESPYVGLRSYTPADENVYVGRERAYESLVVACRANQTTVVVGDSGAGKSSLLSAGLIGRACAPGGPLDHLTPRLLPAVDLLEFAPPTQPTLLVIDQFEETAQLPAEIRTAVFDALAALPSTVTCVVALAAHAFGFALSDERFAAHLEAPVLLGPLTTSEYTRIIEEPAQRHGRRVSPELVQQVLRDLHLYGEPAPGTALPLLSSAMRRCWRHADGQALETGDYLATGGLWSALHDEAEATFLSLNEDQQVIARRLLLSMVHRDGEHLLRRTITIDGLTPEMTAIVDAFLAARLFSATDEHITISHDALLAHWTRLQEWIADEKASLAIARRIQLAAQLWDEGGRSTESLMPIGAETWSAWAASNETPLLSPRENAFIRESLDLAEAQQHEQATTIKRLQRRQNLAITAAVVAGIMVIATTTASFQANRYREIAEAATINAQSRQIALIADELRPLAPNTAGQLSVAAYSMSDSVQTRSAVLTSAGNPMPTRIPGPPGNTMVAYAPDGDLIVRGDSSGEITIWRDGDLGSDAVSVQSGGNQLFTLTVAEIAGRTLALVGGQQTAGVWDLTGTPVKIGEYGADTVSYSSSWHDGVVHIGTLEGEIRRIDLSDPASPAELSPFRLGGDVAVSSLSASPYGVFAGGLRDSVEIFDHEGERAGALAISGTALALSASGSELLVGSANGNATHWALSGSEPTLLAELPFPGLVHAVRHEGERLLIAGSFGAIHEYTHDHELAASYPERTVVVSLDSVNGQPLAGATGGTTTLWSPASDTTVLVAPDDVRLYDLLHGDDVVAVGTSVGARIMMPTAEGWTELVRESPTDGSDLTYYYDISDDGRVLINQTSTGELLTFERDGDRYEIIDSMGGQETVVALKLSATGRYMALGYRGEADYQLYERSSSGWSFIASLDGWPGANAFSLDEAHFATMNYDGDGVVVWDLTGGAPAVIAELALPGDVTPMSMSYAPNGDLAIGDNRGEISIFSFAEPASPIHAHQLRDARSSLSQVTYSADGDRLLAATREGQLWVWRIGAEIVLDLQLTPGTGAVSGAIWFDDQVVMSADGRTVAWPGDPATAAADLCTRFGPSLTSDEWGRLVPDVDLVNGCTALAE